MTTMEIDPKTLEAGLTPIIQKMADRQMPLHQGVALATLSQAISLKRIADALQQLTSAEAMIQAGGSFGVGLNGVLANNALSENHAYYLGQAFERGRR